MSLDVEAKRGVVSISSRLFLASPSAVLLDCPLRFQGYFYVEIVIYGASNIILNNVDSLDVMCPVVSFPWPAFLAFIVCLLSFFCIFFSPIFLACGDGILSSISLPFPHRAVRPRSPRSPLASSLSPLVVAATLASKCATFLCCFPPLIADCGDDNIIALGYESQ